MSFAPTTPSGVGGLADLFMEMGKDATLVIQANASTTQNILDPRELAKMEVNKFIQKDQNVQVTASTAREMERMCALLLISYVTCTQTVIMEKMKRTAKRFTRRRN